MSQRSAVRALFGLGCSLVPAGCMEPVDARVGPNRTVEPGATVTLDGSRSYPRDLNRIDFLWEVIDGPEVTLTDSKAAITTFTAPSQAGIETVVARLTVTYIDLSGQVYPPNSDTAFVRVRVQADPDATDTAEQEDTAADDGDGTGDGTGDPTTIDNGDTAGDVENNLGEEPT